MAKEHKTRLVKPPTQILPAQRPSLSIVTPTPVEKSLEDRRLDAVLALPPHIGDTLAEDDTRDDTLLFLLAQTTDRDQVSEYKETHEEEARIRGRAESVAIVEAAVRGTLNKPTGEITRDDLAPIKTLLFAGTNLTDLTPLAGLTALKHLDLSGTQVSGVTPLAKLIALEALHLADTQVSDITPLAGLNTLKMLNLAGTQVADTTPLDHIKGLRIYRRYRRDFGLSPQRRD